MENQSSIIDPQKLSKWNEEYKEFGIKVTPETALYYEIETFYPHHVITDGNRVKYFYRDGSPFFDENNWIEIEPLNIPVVFGRIQSLQPQVVDVDDVKGWLIPLRESTFAISMEDVNAFIHNLMFWESVLPAKSCGPMTQRLSWLTGKLYTMRADIRDSIVIMGDKGLNDLSITTDNTREIIEYALRNRKDEEMKQPSPQSPDDFPEKTRQIRSLVERMISILNE